MLPELWLWACRHVLPQHHGKGSGMKPLPLKALACSLQVQHRYFLLVILTTSTGNDLEEFRASLVQAATDLALSVIVVGLGSADFRPLEVWPAPVLHCCPL